MKTSPIVPVVRVRGRSLAGLAAAIGAGLTAAAPARPVITFEGLANGLDVEATATAFAGLSGGISTDGNGLNHLGAALFDSGSAGPNAGGPDPDLLVDFGNLLILQSTSSPGKAGDVWSTPNDSAGGGMFTFTFDAAVTMTSIDLVDIDGGGTVTVGLFDASGGSRLYMVADDWTGDASEGDPGAGTLDLTTLDPQAGFASMATALDFGLDADDVVTMTVRFDGSAGLDNVSFTPVPAAPTAALLVGALVAGRRRRRA